MRSSSVIVIFTRKGYVVEKLLNINLKNLNYLFLPIIKKVHDLSSLRINTEVVKTSKFEKNFDFFIYKNIKKFQIRIFTTNKNIFLIYAAFARKILELILCLIKKKDFS